MITNYIKLAIRGMGRRKFFTFISLFGISFTLGILMVNLSFLQSELGANKPLSNKDDFVFMSHLALKRTHFDTIPNIDTTFDQGIAVYDTTFEYKKTGSSMTQSNISHDLIKTFFSNLPSTENLTAFNPESINDVYINGIKLSIQTMYTDANYWKMFDHSFIEGRSFNETDVEISAPVAVISSKTALNYFGVSENVIDKEIEIGNNSYKIIGVFKHVGKFIPFVSPDLVLPYAVEPESPYSNYYNGSYRAMFQKKSDVSVKKMKEDILTAAATIPIDHPDNQYGYNELEVIPASYMESFAQNIYYDKDPEKSLRTAKWIVYSLFLFFLLLPTLNLINLNISRILDRSSEIGVRKAFGAHQGNIIFQFIIENIVQTFIGGVLGLALAIIIINILNKGGFLGSAELNLYPKFFIYSFLATLFFGILSGLLPAWRMSKLHIVKALKNAKL